MSLMLALVLAAAPAPAGSAEHRGCSVPPRLARSAGFADPRGLFGPGSRALGTLERRFASAYRLVCRSRTPGAPLPPGPLFLRNAPDANTASIYREGEEGVGTKPGPMVMEYPFIGHDRMVRIPSVEELRSAIMCSINNINPPSGAAEDAVECLVD